jgi:2-alkyl-3-oxoalkanoate reductase
MKVFVAGSTGVIGRMLLPVLLEEGHEVIALVRNTKKGRAVEEMGAKTAFADAFNKEELTAAVRKAEPEVIIHQLTAIPKDLNFKKLDEQFVLTNRLRTEVLDSMIAAGHLVGARRFIAQSLCGWPFARVGGPVKTEDDPLDPNPPAGFSKTLAAIRYLEDAIRKTQGMEAIALRYGFLYGPGATFAKGSSTIELIRRRGMPIIGGGGGVWSFLHVEDAARSTAAALTCGEAGIYNIVDDEPAPVSTWLPFLADILGAKPPLKAPAWLGKMMIGEGGLSLMTRVRGGDNQMAKCLLGWQPVFSSWRAGFVKEFC